MKNSQNSDPNGRSFLRLPRPYRVQARLFTFPLPEKPLIDCLCADIGRGGLCLRHTEPLEKGTRLFITVHIPRLNKYSTGFYKVHENEAEQYFHAIAEVVWNRLRSSVHHIGIEFIDADEDLSRALDRLVQQALDFGQRTPS